MDELIIDVRCEGTEYISFRILKDLQGDLKKLPIENENKLLESLKKYGFTFPDFVWQDGDTYFTVDGHQRNTVSEKHNIKFRKYYDPAKNTFVNPDDYESIDDLDEIIDDKIPVAKIWAKNRVEAKEKLLVENSKYGIMTDEGLVNFLTEAGYEINLPDIDNLLQLGEIDLEYISESLNESLNNAVQVEEDNFDEEPPIVPKTQNHDLYELNGHRLYCGNSIEEEDVNFLMNSKKAHMIFTDPPYNINYAEFNLERDSSRDWVSRYCYAWHDSMTDEDYINFLNTFIGLAKKHSIEYAHFYVWYASKYHTEVINAFAVNDIPFDKVPIIWKKQAAPITWARYKRIYEPCIFGGKGAINGAGKKARWFGPNNEICVWEINRDHNVNYIHPTQKPVTLAGRAITNSSKEKEIVLDLFMGSGSTMIASDMLNRTCYGMEMSPDFCDAIVKRFIKYCQDNNKPYNVKRNGQPIDLEFFNTEE